MFICPNSYFLLHFVVGSLTIIMGTINLYLKKKRRGRRGEGEKGEDPIIGQALGQHQVNLAYKTE